MKRENKIKSTVNDLDITEIALLSEYKSESETSIGSALPLYTSLPLPPPQLSLSPIDSLSHYNISQLNLHEIIRQQQEQLAAMQAQIQALLTAQRGVETGAGTRGEAVGSSIRSHMEVAIPAIFNREVGKVGGFITACRLFLRMKLRGVMVEE